MCWMATLRAVSFIFKIESVWPEACDVGMIIRSCLSFSRVTASSSEICGIHTSLAHIAVVDELGLLRRCCDTLGLVASGSQGCSRPQPLGEYSAGERRPSVSLLSLKLTLAGAEACPHDSAVQEVGLAAMMNDAYSAK